MLDLFLEHTQKRIKNNEPFVIAIVVRKDAPSSGKVGDKAIITKFGEIIGWVGGGCVKGILIKESLEALKSGKGRLVKIGKSIKLSKQEGVMEYKMTCQSEGTIEVFIEPVLPKPHIVVIGESENAKALTKLASAVGFKVTGVAQGATLTTFPKVDELITQINLTQVKTTPATFIIIATQGEGDEKALLESLKKERAFIGFIASKKKMISVSEYLKSYSISKSEIASIRAPIGKDIKAKSPDEVAISILAELIEYKNTHNNTLAFEKFETSIDKNNPKPVYYTNPVCGVPVDMNNPKHIVEYKGEKVYFCCDGCKVKFDAEPSKYIVKAKK